ncbi:metal-dependent amidase/aminoacylase/carboxypeptidase family protein [Chryseobacterium sediminis]|uniref:Metal-dependent amidase/aminoacylase/carboxypeptidase family protein n=1 Tax=Chryseobacterium sediminis TaxID=1679494 RepID=A0ABR6PY29_9FLAO|nr:amidohydrolase [Chryseobacterium sediminis]MBB6330623.1 metal-dependent amidase/aminoacylase/carboxypeptidase family protein [Chryseobacterium sediminis]
MRKLTLVLLCLISSLLPAQKLNNQKEAVAQSSQNISGQTVHQSVQLETDRVFNKLVNIRRAFHENPELAGKEKQTQEKIKQYLLDLGLEVQTDHYGHSVIGILKGDQKGKKIAWRADMDALPNDYPDPETFKSKIKGIQHGCGHDIHMAIGLGIAEVLSKNKKSLKGTIYFIFQPEEETFKGAKEMLNNGLLSKINPDEIYGLHVTATPVGQIMVKPGEMFAYQKKIRIQLKKGLSEEELNGLTKKISNSLFRASPGSNPWEIQSIVDPKIGLTNPDTIFKDYLFTDGKFNIYSKNNESFLEAYLYETNSFNLDKIIPEVQKIVEDNGYKNQLLSISFVQENPTVINNEKLTTSAIEILQNLYGKNAVASDYGQIPFFNDDFAYFQQKIPGVYFFLGGSNFEKGVIAMNHSPNFQVDEESIRIGVKSFSSLMIERLSRN